MNDTKLAPGLLVATPQLRDPNFEQTVIVLFDHGESGAVGLVVNRSLDLRMSQILADLDIVPAVDVDRRVHFGGPVEMEVGWVVHSPDYEEATTRVINADLSVSTSREVLEAIALGDGPRDYILCLGYSGWGPGQLESEVGQGAWLTSPLTPDLLFDVPLEERWRACYHRLGIDPLQLSGTIGNA